MLDQHENNLWMDAGMVTTQADWSLAHEMGVFKCTLKFLLNVQQFSRARRLN